MKNQTAEGPIRDDDPNTYIPPKPGDEGYDEYMEVLQQQRIQREKETFARVIRSYESRTPLLRDRPQEQTERIRPAEEAHHRRQKHPEDHPRCPQNKDEESRRTPPQSNASKHHSGHGSKA